MSKESAGSKPVHQVTIAAESGALFVFSLDEAREAGELVPGAGEEIGQFPGGLVPLKVLQNEFCYVVNFRAFARPPKSRQKLVRHRASEESLPNHPIVVVDLDGNAYYLRPHALYKFNWSYSPNKPKTFNNQGYALAQYQIVQGVRNAACIGRPTISLMYLAEEARESEAFFYAGVVLNCASFREPDP